MAKKKSTGPSAAGAGADVDNDSDIDTESVMGMDVMFEMVKKLKSDMREFRKSTKQALEDSQDTIKNMKGRIDFLEAEVGSKYQPDADYLEGVKSHGSLTDLVERDPEESGLSSEAKARRTIERKDTLIKLVDSKFSIPDVCDLIAQLYDFAETHENKLPYRISQHIDGPGQSYLKLFATDSLGQEAPSTSKAWLALLEEMVSSTGADLSVNLAAVPGYINPSSSEVEENQAILGVSIVFEGVLKAIRMSSRSSRANPISKGKIVMAILQRLPAVLAEYVKNKLNEPV
jgi:hypothetical protein